MTLLISFLGLVGVAAVWVTATRLRYHLGDRPTLHLVTTADGWTLSLWHRAPATRRFREPVVLCHGLGNNHAFFEFRGRSHLARVLSDAGFDVFTMDCRGAGRWRAPDPSFPDATIDDSVEADAPAVVETIERLTGQRRVLWVGHSLGGVIGLLASPRALRGRVSALVTIGSPLFFAPSRFMLRALTVAQWASPGGRFPLRVVATAFAPVSGWFSPPRLADITARVSNIDFLEQRFLLANVFADVWRGVLGQLERWIRSGAFTSMEGVDLRGPALAQVDVPVLVIGGSVDQLAPPEMTRRYFDALATPEKKLVLVGEAHGNAVEYGHGDLIVGRDAARDVYPAIREFLVAHATASEATPGSATA